MADLHIGQRWKDVATGLTWCVGRVFDTGFGPRAVTISCGSLPHRTMVEAELHRDYVQVDG